MALTRTRRTRRQRFLAVLTAGLLVAGGAGAGASGPDPGSEPAPEPGALGLSLGGLLGRALGPSELLEPSSLGRLRVPGDVRVLVVSSGADQATFGDGYAKSLSRSADVDGVGLGTYAASVVFQVAPKAHVTAVDVYRKGKVDRAAVADALHWAREHAQDLDAVVLAFPPAALLDPMSAGLAAGAATASGGPAQSERVATALSDGWAKLREDAAALTGAGLAVVAPAGDLGPGPQSVLGVAGLPEVITVGAADRDGVARASAGGPSAFGRAKPDLVAPAGIAGLVPDESALAGLLDLNGPGGAAPALDLPFPAAGGRAALVGSTIPAAAAVGAIAAQLHRDGVADGAILRGSSWRPPSRWPGSPSGDRAPAVSPRRPGPTWPGSGPSSPGPPTSAPNPPPATTGVPK